jgi:transcriptional regulator with XRE-family HTH domain
MLRTNLPRAIRALRRRRRWRQADLAAAAGVSRETVSRVERGKVHGLTLRSVERMVAALGATTNLLARWEGAELDRTIDAAHAALQERVGSDLRSLGWLVRVEVSFNHFGDRGRVDVVACHPATRVVLVIEVKSAFGDLQETIGRLDVKVRLGASIAQSAGWSEVTAIVPVLAVADARSVRRIVRRHPALFERYQVRGRQVPAWLRRPTLPAPSGLLWYVPRPDSRAVTVTPTKRVRPTTSSR